MATSKSVSTEALTAAALAAQGKNQIGIAKALGLSQSAVSRLLKDVQEYIQVERTFRWEKLTPPEEQAVRKRMSQSKIGDCLAELAAANHCPAPTVHIVPVGDIAQPGPQFDTFAIHAAMILRELLEDVRGRVGVAWGSTLWHTTHALRSQLPKRPIRGHGPIEFVPLCGDPLIDSQERYADRTSSRIVSELSKAVNGDEPRPAWLGLVPAFIPRTFKRNQMRVIDRLIDLVPQYGRIFGPRIPNSRLVTAPIAGDLQMIITAAGPAKRPLGFGRNPLLGLSDSESADLAANIYGDIGGVLLPRLTEGARGKGRAPRPHPLVEELARRWTGLKLDHLKTCAARAFSEMSKSRPGVTLLSFGPSHVEIVVEAVRQGLVNHLIIGSDLELAIENALLPEASASPSVRSIVSVR